MAGLNRELQASSLLECIVAAVILLASFMITMETLTRVTLTGDDPAENVSMELTARQCRREYGDGLHLPGKYTREYDWGTVEIVITDYSFGIRQLTVTALPVRGRKSNHEEEIFIHACRFHAGRDVDRDHRVGHLVYCLV